MENKIQLVHPEGKKGLKIEAKKYEILKSTIFRIIESSNENSFEDLLINCEKELFNHFNGSISWYATWVKLDLEAKGIILCNRKGQKQMIKLGK